MTIEEKFPTMTDAQLKSLSENVSRLAATGTDIQKMEAGRLRPLIAAELQVRSEAAAAAKAAATTRMREARAKPTKTPKVAKAAK